MRTVRARPDPLQHGQADFVVLRLADSWWRKTLFFPYGKLASDVAYTTQILGLTIEEVSFIANSLLAVQTDRIANGSLLSWQARRNASGVA